MASHSSGDLSQPAYPTVPKVQPEECEAPSESFRGYGRPTKHTLQADIQLPAYSNQLIPSDSYNFLTGEEAELLEVPLKETSQSQGASDADVGSAQSSALLGTLFSNPGGPSPGSYLNQSSSAPKSSSWGSVTAAAQYSNPVQNILISGSGLLAAPTSTATAQLIVGGIHGDSFEGSRDRDPSGAVYYPSSNNSQEAMQLYYVNQGFPNGFSSDGSGVTVIYPPPDGQTISSSSQQVSCSHIQRQYSVPFLPSNLAPSGLSQRALEAISSPAGIPLSHQSLAASRQSYSNWRNGGNEHSFIPMNEASQNTSSQFGTDLPPYGVRRGAHDLSHMQQTDQLQGEAGHNIHMDHLYAVNGQGLSLSLSSHQPQSSALHYQGQIPEPNMDAVAAFSQAAAIVKTKEEASRYNSTSSHAGLNLYRIPTREDVLGARFQHDHVNIGARKHLDSSLSGHGGSAASSSHFSASGFLRSAQDILNEVCRVTALKRPPKPATRSSELHWNMAAGSSASIDGNLTYHGKLEDRTAVLTEVDSARDPASFADTTLLMTSGSHVSHSTEMSQSLADTARTENRDDLELKKGKLGVMLDEVEGRYRRYCDHLQLVITGFNSQAGPNTATPYTILALQAMSRHFRCLRDAIGSQLRVVKRALGEDDGFRTGRGETSRLRYMDQQIRQQRALQQLGMLQQHAWRPQRGLPERAVSVLRAWLFEHFLHPYPKDVDKMSLAKQTGLTRSQVSNWFINARVRLWKPMVEEMYLEEQREAEEAAVSERLAREQGDMGINNFEQYKGDRGLQINAQAGIGQLTSISQKSMDLKDREDAVGLNAEGQTGTCSEQTREVLHCTPSSSNGVAHTQMLAEEQEQQQVAAGRAVDAYSSQESREAKRARNYAGSNTSNAHPSIISAPVFHTDRSENYCANSEDYSTDSEDMCKTDNAFSPGHGLHRDEDMYSMSQKGAASIGQLEPSVSAGSFGTYEGNNFHRYDHDARTLAYVPRTSGGVNSATCNTAVSLTLGLRHCESNLRSSMGPNSMLSKYNRDMHEQTNNQLITRVADQFEGDVDDSSNNGGHHSSAGFSNGHYLHPLHSHSDDSNHPVSPGRGKRVASQALVQHEFVAN